MNKKSHIYIVCSDQTRNGKTLFARLFTDFLLVQGGHPFVMDLEAPTGNICEYFPDISEVFDIGKVAGQMELFDWVIGNPGRDYVLDVPARLMLKLFTIMDDINFVEAAGSAGFEVVVFYLLEGDAKSLDTAQMVFGNYTVDRFFVVRHEEMDNDLRNFSKLSVFHEISAQGQVVLPEMDEDLIDVIERPDFSFREFIEGDDSDLPAKTQFKLASYLEVVVEGVQKIKRRIDIGPVQRVERDGPQS